MLDNKDSEQDPLVLLALKTLNCTQKELAEMMEVSTTQVTKWKKGEGMSMRQARKLRQITGLAPADNAEFSLSVGSIRNARFWQDLLEFINRISHERYFEDAREWPFELDDENLAPSMFYLLTKMGVDIPNEIPPELAHLDFKKAYEENEKNFLEGGELVDDCEEAINSHPLTRLINAIFKNHVDVYFFYSSYIATLLLDDRLNLDQGSSSNMELVLDHLTASKLTEEDDVDLSIASKFEEFRADTQASFRNWIQSIKNAAQLHGLPLRAELMEIIDSNVDQLRALAEEEWHGHNDERAHPDIYINELLVGIRRINKVLPAILEKLGIDEDDLPDPN